MTALYSHMTTYFHTYPIGKRAFQGHPHRPTFPQADHRNKGRENPRDSRPFQRHPSLVSRSGGEERRRDSARAETGRGEMRHVPQEDGLGPGENGVNA